MIGTDRLILRRWREEDAVPFHAMGQDAEVMRHLGPAMRMADCRRTIGRMNAVADRCGRSFWAMERRADHAFIGFCGVQPGPARTPIAGKLEIGWRLAHAAWGLGYAREAATACLLAEWRRGTREVVAVTTPANTRSLRLMRRLGMVRDGEGDFNHPALSRDDPLRGHVTYRIRHPS